MPSKNTKFYSLLLIIADFIVLLGAFGIAYILRVQYDPRPLLTQVYAVQYVTTFLLIIPFWLLIFASLGLYQSNTYSRRLVEWSKIAIGSCIGILTIIGWEYFSGQHVFPARLVAVYALIGSFLLILVERETLRLSRSLLFYFGKGTSRVLVIGDSDATRDIADSISNTYKSGYSIVAIAGPRKIIPSGLDVKHFSSIEAALK
jgi:FlaA1/EpsC-like NDP-sugar epimerase